MQLKAKNSKEETILNAAYQTFLSYGFKRTNMDDIAQAAGMSRPALYLVYKNKKDIFRACLVAIIDALQEKLETVVQGDGGTLERVTALLDAAIVEPHVTIGATPHGEELFALKSDIAGDLFGDWMAVIEDALLTLLRMDAERGLIDLDASGVSVEEIADIVASGAEGIKLRAQCCEDLPEKLSALVKLTLGPLISAKSPATKRSDITS